ncbi:uncharacterized protein METZ01_LOCUS122376, partial [marine metagenome]|tara:strand:+ start:174 stop:515 length:342 start_codon:yes stop_codon:yes gene_type:complete
VRAKEIILQEDRWDPEYIKHEVLTLLTSAAAEGITQLSPVNLLQDLKAMGYPMTMSGLFELLQGTELVKNMNRDVIELAITDADMFSNVEKSEADADKIHKTAVKQANKDIGI